VRIHEATGLDICPVAALAEHARHNPHWLQDPGTPVFGWDGKGVTRELVSDILKTAAAALGYPPHLIGSHSLRKGGATAGEPEAEEEPPRPSSSGT
jgi:hypothetical protein